MLLGSEAGGPQSAELLVPAPQTLSTAKASEGIVQRNSRKPATGSPFKLLHDCHHFKDDVGRRARALQ